MKKEVSLVFLILMITLLHADLSKAASGEINGTSSACGGSVEDCLIADNLDAESLMDSHASRMLLDVSKTQTGNTGKIQAAVNCPPSQRYRNCQPPPNPNVPRQRCGDYNRVC